MQNKIQIGNWEVGVGDTRYLEQDHIKSLTQLVEKWSDVEASLRTQDEVPVWAVTNLGIPTILCRVDVAPFSSNESPAEKIFEIEARPAGFGILLNLFPEIERISSFWEPLMPIGAVVLNSRGAAAEDTRIFSSTMGWQWVQPEECNNGVPDRIWARGSILDDGNGVNLARLEQRALAPLRSHGDKTYLLEMGLAEKVTNPELLPWDEAFTVKPQKGSKSDDVFLWHPGEKKKKTNGLYTKTKIVTSLKGQERPFLMQPFIFPEEEEHDSSRSFTIWRIYFAYDARNSAWSFAGGLWNRRPCLKVHGASDSTFGPLVGLEQ